MPYQNLSRKILHFSELINLIERLTITNCSQSDVTYQGKDPYQVIHGILDESGLNVDYIKQHVNDTDQMLRATDNFKIRILDILSFMNIDKSFKQKFK